MTVSVSSAVKAAPLDPDALSAWFEGKAPRRLLAIPFSAPGGRDLDGEHFSQRTDIKPSWFEARPVLFHHGVGPAFGSGLVGKSDNLGSQDGQKGEPDDDGWWVDLWLMAGEKNAQRVRTLVERGAELFGSSAAIPHLVKRGKAGHIDVWPYIEQTLTTAPINRHSTFAPPMKAVLDDFSSASIAVPDLVREALTALDSLRDLHDDLPSGGEAAAKAADEEAFWSMTIRTIDLEADRLLRTLRGRTDG